MKLTVDMAKVSMLSDALHAFAKKGVPFAARKALNDTAFLAREQWVSELGKKLTLRNTWTARSLRVEKVKGGYNVDAMESKVGSLAAYMGDVEHGSTETKRGKHGVAVPTTSAAGQAMSASKRTKPIRRTNYLSAIQVAARVSGNRKQRNAAAIAIAAKTNGVAYLDLGQHKGLYRITGTKRGIKVRKLYDLSKASVRTKAHPTLEPAIAAIQSRLPALYIAALKDQLRRNHVPFF
jgi:hypothetical protein